MRRIPGTGCAGAAATPTQVNCFPERVMNNVVTDSDIAARRRVVATAFMRSIRSRYYQHTRAISCGGRMRDVAIFHYPSIAANRYGLRAGVTDDIKSVNRDIAILDV